LFKIVKIKGLRMMEFRYKIEKRIVDEAVKCEKEFQCLSGDEECLCPVEDEIEGNILFVQSLNVSCPYRISFGYSFICTCPVRKYLFIRYKV